MAYFIALSMRLKRTLVTWMRSSIKLGLDAVKSNSTLAPCLCRRMAMFLTTFFTKSCTFSGCMYSRMAPDSDRLARNTFSTRTPRRLFSSRMRLR